MITGANGFLGKELNDYYSNSKHDVTATTREVLELTNYEQVKEFLSCSKFDVVLHTAVKGGKRIDNNKVDFFYENLKMFMNLESLNNHYGIMFNFGSGAEFDTQKNLYKVKEQEVLSSFPNDYYGLSKNLITRKILESDNIYNLRLFGCFGFYEEPQRLFKNCFSSLKNNRDFVIHEDKFMDYFYAQDVGIVIDCIIKKHSSNLYKDFNLCYNTEYKLSQLVNKVYDFQKVDKAYVNNKKQSNKNYSGDPARINEFQLNLKGIDKGLEECLTKWNKFYN